MQKIIWDTIVIEWVVLSGWKLISFLGRGGGGGGEGKRKAGNQSALGTRSGIQSEH